MFPLRDLEEFFVGQWGLERDIADEAGSSLGAFSGEAAFTRGEGELVFHEWGTLVLGVHRAPAHRTLHFRLDGGARARVHFDYGDFFHDLDLSSGRWQAQHPCRDDLYRGEFVVCGRDEWWQRWSVAGPTKNHVLTTRFLRR
ncbi:hypothetical protein GIY23_11230 [Allosaccharopolyspora coralli]|uniref:DUF6314 domain-containing protein n=2 Tax=Allosaccharopolyspora coralli TaxID=2665642 RepID=A0A5Q3QL05_9PSEU|nr:hypothetical protein GIY23_11230 [Allosaccharopolyspora coralli]